MKCYKCTHYESGEFYNCCCLTDSWCFIEPYDCDLVNDDGSNYNNEYFKRERKTENDNIYSDGIWGIRL